MIFVTVGTHEQQFNRLIQKVDELKRDGIIKEDVFIQTGFSTYEPQYCQWKKLLSYDEMNEMYEKADIIITHGGPASFMKVPYGHIQNLVSVEQEHTFFQGTKVHQESYHPLFETEPSSTQSDRQL